MDRQELQDQLVDFFSNPRPFRVTFDDGEGIEFNETRINIMQAGKVSGFDSEGSPIEVMLDDIKSMKDLSDENDSTPQATTTTESDFRHLFPPYLDVGSSGDAVTFMQQLLCSMGYKIGCHTIGMHTGDSVKAMEKLQLDMGFPQSEVDGNFGPGTREKLKTEHGIDVDVIPAHVGHQTTWNSPRGSGHVWR